MDQHEPTVEPEEALSGGIDAPLTREVLYGLVWTEPMLKVAARLGVSSSYMARVCAQMNVPRPERGYWAKFAVGKAPKQTQLPVARPGDLLVWSRDGEANRMPVALPRPPAQTRRRRAVNVISPDLHPLIAGAKSLFEAGRLSYESGYLKPTKRLLVDLTVTKTGLEKALAFANQLFNTLEAHGHRVAIAQHGEGLQRVSADEREQPRKERNFENLWAPGRCTVVYVGTVAIGLSILETSEEVVVRYVDGKYIRDSEYVPTKRRRYAIDHTWTTTKDLPTDRLFLHAYSPYPRAEWQRQWREAKGIDLTTAIPKIVKELEGQAAEIAKLVEEGARQAEIEHRQWEEQWEKWKREEEARRAEEALKESKDELMKVIEDWAEAKRIEAFFHAAEQALTDLPDQERSYLVDRLEQARALVGAIDALDFLRKWSIPTAGELI